MGADHHQFTAAERREVFLQCAMGVLEALAGGLGEAATLQVLIDVVDSDMARLALVTAQVASVRSVIGLLLGPTGGAVTDSVGRKPSPSGQGAGKPPAQSQRAARPGGGTGGARSSNKPRPEPTPEEV